MRRPWLLVCATLAAAWPAAPFVFVPTRAPVRPKWSVPAGEPTALYSDALGNLYRLGPRRIEALAERDGAHRWVLQAAAGERFVNLLDAGGTQVAVAADAADLHRLHLRCVSTTKTEGGAPEAVWDRLFDAVPSDGVHLDYDPVRQADADRLAVVTADRLLVLDAASGEERRAVRLGAPAGPPTWADGFAFVPVAAAPTPEVVAVPLDHDGVTRLPARGLEQPSASAWFERAGLLVVTGRSSLHVAKFVFVPTRIADEAMTPLPSPVGRCRVADADDGSLLVAGDQILATYDPEHREPRWTYAPPAGWQVASTPAAVEDCVVVLERSAQGEGRLTCFDLAAPGTARERWQQAAGAVRMGGFYLPQTEDLAPARPAVAVLARGSLHLIDVRNGTELARRELALGDRDPLWVEDSLFCLAATPDGGAAVLGFDLLRPEDLPKPELTWSWPVPAGETVEDLSWQAAGRLLVVRTNRALYVFE